MHLNVLPDIQQFVRATVRICAAALPGKHSGDLLAAELPCESAVCNELWGWHSYCWIPGIRFGLTSAKRAKENQR